MHKMDGWMDAQTPSLLFGTFVHRLNRFPEKTLALCPAAAPVIIWPLSLPPSLPRRCRDLSRCGDNFVLSHPNLL